MILYYFTKRQWDIGIIQPNVKESTFGAAMYLNIKFEFLKNFESSFNYEFFNSTEEVSDRIDQVVFFLCYMAIC